MGRPSKYTQAFADEVCTRLAAGETLRAICKTTGLPGASTVLSWVDLRPEFAERYARARRDGLEVLAEELIEIADDATNDYMDRQVGGEEGDTIRVLDAEHVQRSRLRVDTRKWLLSKLRPDKYGDRSAVELTGAAGGPIQSEHKIIFVEPEEKA